MTRVGAVAVAVGAGWYTPPGVGLAVLVATAAGYVLARLVAAGALR